MVYATFLDWNPSQRIGAAEFVGLRNYEFLLQDESFRESLAVTIKFAVLVVGIEMVLGVGLALLLDRQIRGMSFFRTVFILPMMIAPIVVGLMWRYMYHPSVGVFNRMLKALGFEPVPWLSTGAGRSRASSSPTSGSGRRSSSSWRWRGCSRCRARRWRPRAWTAPPSGSRSG